jgi:chromate transporter
MNNKIRYQTFLWDVLMCSLGSYGGPEAHYGVFSSVLVEKKKYLTENELTELIGLYALVPGPSSTQTITAIGYKVGGAKLAFLTFLVWAMPAILIMALFGVFFTQVSKNDAWKPIVSYLPAIAVSFIVFAAYKLSFRVVKSRKDLVFYGVMLLLGLLLVPYSVFVVPLLLVSGGLVRLLPKLKDRTKSEVTLKPRWAILGLIVFIALINEVLFYEFKEPLVTLFTSFYRYGYSVIGGGQIVIPLMIQDLVQTQSLISLSDFLSGYAIDQAVPGPLFSFAAFVSARSFQTSQFAFLFGIIGGLSIFLPGILLVYFIFPLWKTLRRTPLMTSFLSGVSLTAASLILMTAINATINLSEHPLEYVVLAIGALLLLTKKIPAPLIVLGAALLGFII